MCVVIKFQNFRPHGKQVTMLPCNHAGTVCKAKGVFAHTNRWSGFMDCLCLVCKQLSHSLGRLSSSHREIASGTDRNWKLRRWYRKTIDFTKRHRSIYFRFFFHFGTLKSCGKNTKPERMWVLLSISQYSSTHPHIIIWWTLIVQRTIRISVSKVWIRHTNSSMYLNIKTLQRSISYQQWMPQTSNAKIPDLHFLSNFANSPCTANVDQPKWTIIHGWIRWTGTKNVFQIKQAVFHNPFSKFLLVSSGGSNTLEECNTLE